MEQREDLKALVRGSFRGGESEQAALGTSVENPFPHPKLLGAHMQMAAFYFLTRMLVLT